MEQRKRIYPAKRNQSRWLSAVLLITSAVIVISGLLSRTERNAFFLEKVPEQTAVPMDEAFDETLTQMLVELPARSWYALQVGVFENEEAALQSSQTFQKRGAAGFLWNDGRFRVLASVYPAKEDAQIVRQQLREQHSIESYLYAIEFPAVSMRLNGMQGQLEILQAAFGHAGDLAVTLQSLSVAMDRQEISTGEVKERLEAVCTQTDLVSLRLKQRFSIPVHETVQALIECFDDYAQFADDLSDTESSITTGMKLKQQTFATLQKVQNVYQTLGHT